MQTTEIKVGNYTICGYSKAGKATSIWIPTFKVVFDVGVCFPQAPSYPIVCITHGHADHIGGLHMHAFERRMIKLPNPLYIMPIWCEEDWLIAHDALKKLNKYYEGITRQFTINTSNSVRLDKFTITSHPVQHKIPSVGYTVWTSKQKLKEEFKSFSRNELITARKQGVHITEDISTPVITFTGDTIFAGMVDNPHFFKSQILIMECSYLGDITKEDCVTRGHICLADILENKSLFHNEYLVLTHFSKKYSSVQIKEACSLVENMVGIPTFVI